MSADAAATNRQYFVVDTLGRGGGGCVPHITDLYHWFLANRRHLVRPTRFPFGSLTPGRPLDCHWIELRQVSFYNKIIKFLNFVVLFLNKKKKREKYNNSMKRMFQSVNLLDKNNTF